MANANGHGRPKEIEGPTMTRMFTVKRGLVAWLVSQAKREGKVPSVIVNRALERERKDGAA